MKFEKLRLVILLCAAAALLLALTQPVLGIIFALLIPFWFFVTDVVVAPMARAREVRKALAFPTLPVFSPRPPPLS